MSQSFRAVGRIAIVARGFGHQCRREERRPRCQVSAASSLVNASYILIFQQSLTSYDTGNLDPASVTFAGT